MTLSQLLVSLGRHGVNLALTDAGKLKPSADQSPPPELIEAIKAHRTVLVRRLERGQRADGRYYLADLLPRPGICASCDQWRQEAPGALMGRCLLVEGPPGIHAAHRCPVESWAQADAETLAERGQQAQPATLRRALDHLAAVGLVEVEKATGRSGTRFRLGSGAAVEAALDRAYELNGATERP